MNNLETTERCFHILLFGMTGKTNAKAIFGANQF